MKFIALVKFRKKPTKEMIAWNLQLSKMEEEKEGVKTIDVYWTLGRYDAVVITEAPNEQAVMRTAIRRAENLDIENLVAIPAVEARKLVE